MTGPTRNGESEQLLDLQGLLAGLRWRRRLWIGVALAGLLLGLLIAVALPAGSTARTSVYVVHSNDKGATGTSLMATDVAVLQTSSVAEAAQQRLQATEGPSASLGGYTGEATAANVLTITASGADDSSAVARAQALADAFVADHVQRTNSLSSSRIQLLQDQRTQAENELAGPGGQAPDNRAQLENRVQVLTTQIQGEGIGAPEVAAGTRIIDTPRATTRPAIVAALINGGIGLILGLGLGLGLAAVATVVADRPVLRRDIAAQLGASVVAQLGNARRGLGRVRPRSAAERERKRVSATLARLVGNGRAPVSVLELGCPDLATDLVVDIACDLAGDRPVRIVDDLPRRGSLQLPAGVPEGMVDVVDVGSAPGADISADGIRCLGLGSVRAGTPWTDIERLGSETILVVRAGSASSEWLHTVARQLADARVAILGVVLVHPDPRDRTDGTLWSGLHTALRGRAAIADCRPSSPGPPKTWQASGRTETTAGVRPDPDSRPAGVVTGRPSPRRTARPSPGPREPDSTASSTDKLRPVAPGGVRDIEKENR